MENENVLLPPGIPAGLEEHPKLYSKRAIWGFSLFFSSIFGGVLLMQNLRDTGRKREANGVLLLSIIYTVASIYIVNIPERPMTGLTYICNMIGGLILTEVFYKRYFPSQTQYVKKKIWKPLIISILISIPFILAVIYGE